MISRGIAEFVHFARKNSAGSYGETGAVGGYFICKNPFGALDLITR